MTTALRPLVFPTAAPELPGTFDTLPVKVQDAIDDGFASNEIRSLLSGLAGVGDDADCIRHVRFWQRELASYRAERAAKYPRL